MILGVVLLGEQFTPGTGIGFVLILAGCWLSSAPSHRTRPAGNRPRSAGNRRRPADDPPEAGAGRPLA